MTNSADASTVGGLSMPGPDGRVAIGVTGGRTKADSRFDHHLQAISAFNGGAVVSSNQSSSAPATMAAPATAAASLATSGQEQQERTDPANAAAIKSGFRAGLAGAPATGYRRMGTHGKDKSGPQPLASPGLERKVGAAASAASSISTSPQGIDARSRPVPVAPGGEDAPVTGANSALPAIGTATTPGSSVPTPRSPLASVAHLTLRKEGAAATLRPAAERPQDTTATTSDSADARQPTAGATPLAAASLPTLQLVRQVGEPFSLPDDACFLTSPVAAAVAEAHPGSNLGENAAALQTPHAEAGVSATPHVGVIEGGTPLTDKVSPNELVDVMPQVLPQESIIRSSVLLSSYANSAIESASAKGVSRSGTLVHASTLPSNQVSPALVALASNPGNQRLVLRLDPVELGHVQIDIARGHSGTTVQVVADRAETLLLLVRDQGHLQHALDQAGLPQQGRSLHFELATASQSSSFSASGGTSGGDYSGESPRSGQGSQRNTPWGESDDKPETFGAPAWRRAGIDITA